MNLTKTRLLYFFLLLFCSSISAQSPDAPRADKVKLGDSPVEKRVAAMLQTIERGDEASIRQFFSEQVAPDFRDAFPIEQHISAFQRMHRDFAGAEVAAVALPKPNSVAVTLKLSGGKYVKLDLAVEPESPHLIAMMGFGPADAPPVGAARPTTSDLTFTSFDELDQRLRQMAEGDKFSGVVFVTQGDRVQFKKA